MELTKHEIVELSQIAKHLRINIIKMLNVSRSGGHPGGSLSIVEILTLLYFKIMRINPTQPTWEERDRFVLSKGHACPALYAVLAERSYFPLYELWNLRRLGSILSGHPDMRKTPGIDISSGTLGVGLSTALGMALGARILRKDFKVYVIIGDGECDEGSIWESAMAASHFKVDNLTAFLDYNGLQVDGRVREIMDIEPLTEKWRSFGWHTLEIDGHDINQIFNAIEEAKNHKGSPTMIIAHTIKGKGVSFMEDKVSYHGTYHITDEECIKALEELGDLKEKSCV